MGVDLPGIPGRPFYGPRAFHWASKHLLKHHGIQVAVSSVRLHRLKEEAGLGPADDVVIGRTGDVYNAITGARLGTLTDHTLGYF